MQRALSIAMVCASLLHGFSGVARAQAQAANGNIEGVVRDESRAVLPGVTVTVTNTDTGLERSTVTNQDGLYRVLLLPLGTYRVVAELSGFRRFEQTGLTLATGQTLVVNVDLAVGGVTETISVSGATPVVDTAKIDVGRNLGEREIKNLPLVSRNPYNFALVQPGVSGFENPEFGVPRFSANGTLLRVNYQIDGNTNTQKDRAGLRLLPMSEVMIQEVKVITSGYAPEFGQTTGMVYNAITPSGTNTLKGSASYRFRRKDFSAFPYPFTRPRTDENKPDTKIDTWTAEAGGPIVRDRLHFFGGFESTYRDLSGSTPVTIRPEDADRLGLAQQPSALPREQTARFYIGKVDWLAGVRAPVDRAIHLLRERLAQQRHVDDRRRAQLHRRAHGLRRRDEVDVGAVRIDDRRQQAERGPRAVRRPSSGAVHERAVRNRSADSDPQRRELRGAEQHDVRRRLRLHAGHLAGHRQFHLVQGQSQLQVRRRPAVRCRRARRVAVFALHVPEHRRVSAGPERRGPAKLHDVLAAVRRSRVQHGQPALQLLRAGRLARERRSEDPVRPPLRRVRLAGRHRRCAVRVLARVQDGHEQLRSASGLCVDTVRRQEHGHPREHRRDVRPAAAGCV